MIHYLPFADYTFESPLKKTEVIKRLHEQTAPMQLFQNKKDKRLFNGTVNTDTFDLTRVINYRNSFNPVMKGTVNDLVYGTEVKVKMRPTTFVIGFSIFWVGFVVLFSGLTLSIPMQAGDPVFMRFIPCIMLIFFFLMQLYGFNSEVRKSKKALEELLEIKTI